MRRLRNVLLTVTLAVTALLAFAAPASAQQLVDASGENGGGGLAFVLMVVMVVGIGGSLFFMDRVRRNRLPDEDDAPQ
jgi:hypothetical protein